MILAITRNIGTIHHPPFRAGLCPGFFERGGQLVHIRAEFDTVKVLKVNRHLKLPAQRVLPRNAVSVGQRELVLDALGQGSRTGCRHREYAIRTGDIGGNRLAVQRQRY